MVLTENVVSDTKILDIFESPTTLQHVGSVTRNKKSKDLSVKCHQARKTGLKRKSLFDMVFQRKTRMARPTSPYQPKTSNPRAKNNFVREILYGKLCSRRSKHKLPKHS